MTKQPKLKLVLVGCEGRMGTTITTQAALENDCVLVGRIDRALRELPDSTDDLVVVDFSSDDGVKLAISVASELNAPLLTGTTGLSNETLEALGQLGTHVPVAVAPNTSLGVAALRHLVGVACRFLRADGQWRVELLEKHHEKKKDAPSGTALDLAVVCSGGGFELSAGEISSIREGNSVGTHEVRFSSSQETLILRHEAHDRTLFARGAILLARSLVNRPPGFYDVAALLDPLNG